MAVTVSKGLVHKAVGKCIIFLCGFLIVGVSLAKESMGQDESLGTLSVTGSGNSLWVLAKQFDVDGNASHWQKMVALFQKNPHAFVNQNLNRLKKGAKLAVPSSSEVQAVTRQEAHRVYSDSLARFQGKKGQEPGSMTESLKLQAELDRTRGDIVRSTEKNTDLSNKLEMLETAAKSNADKLDFKNRQIESIRARLEQLEASLGGKSKI